ncbi:hypothetical protein ABGB18_05285 [Nonomuraea sp. B12E4]|uniref:hypothetical protein n=1 Tax=Nonomuraea sp. B12E4 TaxID=3153564 RepID=UPI00325DE655
MPGQVTLAGQDSLAALREAALSGLREEAGELEQCMAVLAACGLDPPSVDVADGDRVLLRAHQALTGQDLELALRCHACAEVSSVRLAPDTVPPIRPRTALLGQGGGLRQPTYGDLLGLPAGGEGPAELLRRCVVGSPSRAPTDADFELVDDSLTGPLLFGCPECGAEVEQGIDVQTVVLRALVRLLDEFDLEVHLLASAYRWDLATIEALPRARRRRLAALAADDRR